MDSGRKSSGAIAAIIARIAHIAPEGVAISGAIVVTASVIFILGFKLAGAAMLLFAIAVALFFRDPERIAKRTAGVVLSAADGRVTAIADIDIPGQSGAGFRRVSVFMSPLNVHVNRAPVAGEITRIEHTPGEFRAAFSDDASEHNERNLIVMRDESGRVHGAMQVAGYLARRIVCRMRVHDKIVPGQRIGLIMFGSRVDHFVPAGYRVTVSVGDRVRAGLSLLAEIDQ